MTVQAQATKEVRQVCVLQPLGLSFSFCQQMNTHSHTVTCTNQSYMQKHTHMDARNIYISDHETH